MGQWIIQLITACAPILVALLGIIPTIISNRKKTEESIRESQEASARQIADMKNTLERHIQENEDESARNRRYRILRFYDEICDHKNHSESHFEDILDDIDEYEKYCSNHPEFRNNRGKVAMECIKATYAEVKNRGGFLIYEPEEHQEREVNDT